MASQNVSNYSFQQLESTVEVERTPQEVLARASAEADAIRERARAEGEAAGRAQGIEQARAEAVSVLNGLAEAIRGVDNTRNELVEMLTRQAGEVSLRIAEQMVGGAFAVQPERVVEVTRAALRRLAERHRVTVLVNPEDLELVAGAVQALQSELGGIEHLDVQADRRIERGGAIAQTAYGEIDATISAQMETARELVESALGGDMAGEFLDDDESGGAVALHGV
jgi:flagellar assembly protein FliH